MCHLEKQAARVIMMMMMNCFCGMVDRRKAFILVSSLDHCQRSSPSQISDTLRAGFEPAQNLSSGLVEGSCTVLITITPRCHDSFSQSQPTIIDHEVRSSLMFANGAHQHKIRKSLLSLLNKKLKMVPTVGVKSSL